MLRLFARKAFVQRQIQLKHVHPRFAEKTQLASFGVLRHELLHLTGRNRARFGDSGGLRRRVLRADMRVQA